MSADTRDVQLLLCEQNGFAAEMVHVMTWDSPNEFEMTSQDRGSEAGM